MGILSDACRCVRKKSHVFVVFVFAHGYSFVELDGETTTEIRDVNRTSFASGVKTVHANGMRRKIAKESNQ